MKATIEWMTENYNLLNETLFRGYLPPCLFSIEKTNKVNTLGSFSLKGKRLKIKTATRRIFTETYLGDTIYINKSNFYERCYPTIWLNNNYDTDEEALLNTLVHEMCHYYTYCDGFCPRQGHGPEFREIAAAVSYRSGKRFSIERLATAEEMDMRTLDSSLQDRVDRRKANRKTNVIALLIYLNGQIRLVLTKSEVLANEIVTHHTKKYGNYKPAKVIISRDANLIEYLFNEGYESLMRTYRFWTVTNDDWVKQINNYDIQIREPEL